MANDIGIRFASMRERILAVIGRVGGGAWIVEPARSGAGGKLSSEITSAFLRPGASTACSPTFARSPSTTALTASSLTLAFPTPHKDRPYSRRLH
jgi:hypothetical protein